ncbi:MAG: glycosyl hydrolase family 18 protein [Flavobacteriales bacterium]
MKKRLLESLTAFLLFGALSLNAQSSGTTKVVAYVPNWIDLNTFSNGIDYSKLTHINIAFENAVNANGDLSYNSQNDILITRAHNNGVKVLMSMGGGSASEDATIRDRYFSLISPANRAAFVAKIAAFVSAHKLDGFDVDLEGPAINGDYEGFIQDLSAALAPNKKLLTAALSQGYGASKVTTATYSYFDWINIMSYDGAGPWDPNAPGQHSSMALAQDNVNYFFGRGVPKSKIVLGVPFYGYGFGSAFSNSPYAYNQIVGNYAGAENSDQAGSTIWYNGVPTIKAKTSYAINEGLGGIMIWSLDNDATGSKSLLTAIYEAIMACVATNIPGTLQSENFCQMSGVQVEDASDTEAGKDVGYIEVGDWMSYKIFVPAAGEYAVQYRVASNSAGKSLQLEALGGGALYGTIAIPNTGGWQNWQTITHTVQLPAGALDVAIATSTGGFNINWMDFSSTVGTSEIKAELLHIYPNPVSDVLTINSPGALREISIYDAAGRLVYNQINPGSEFTVDVENFENGFYTVVAIDADCNNRINSLIK